MKTVVEPGRPATWPACIGVARKHHNRSPVHAISGITQAAEPLCVRVGVPVLGNATAEHCEDQELLALAPGACQVSAGSLRDRAGSRTVTRPHIPVSSVSAHTVSLPSSVLVPLCSGRL